MCGEFMQRFSSTLRGTLGSYLRDALQEGSADAVACLPVPRAHVFSCFLHFARRSPLLCLVYIISIILHKLWFGGGYPYLLKFMFGCRCHPRPHPIPASIINANSRRIFPATCLDMFAVLLFTKHLMSQFVYRPSN
jgi:hypothetical protein